MVRARWIPIMQTAILSPLLEKNHSWNVGIKGQNKENGLQSCQR